MTMVLDQLIFAPAPLPLCHDWTRETFERSEGQGLPRQVASPGLAREICSADNRRRLQIDLPGMVRGLSASSLGNAWPAFCGLLQKTRIPLECEVKELEPIAAADVPIRIGRLVNQQPLDPVEVQTADLLELSLRSRKNEWGWPVELGEPKQLSSFLLALREAAGSGTPVGVELPVGADTSDVAEVIAAKADFLTLYGDRMDELAIWGLAKARRQIDQAASADAYPILVDLPLRDAFDAVKCVALGASLVNLNRLFEKHVEQQAAAKASQTGEMQPDAGRRFTSKLPSIVLDTGKEQTLLLKKLSRVLSGFQTELERHMRLCGVQSLADFDQSCLRTSDRRIAELTGVRLLQEA